MKEILGLTEEERAQLGRCLDFIAYEPDVIVDGAFHPRLGLDRTVAQAISEAWPDVDSFDSLDVHLFIWNSLNELAHGVSLTTVERERLSLADHEVHLLFNAWRAQQPNSPSQWNGIR